MSIYEKAVSLMEKAKAVISGSDSNVVRFDGVNNVSRSDLNEVVLYCRAIELFGNYSSTFTPPHNQVASVLAQNGLLGL